MAFLVFLTVIYTSALTIAAAHAVMPVIDRVRVLWTLIFVVTLIWWIYDDKRIRGLRVPYDFEAFAFFAWPIVIPYYLWRSRRRRGLVLGLGLAALYFLPYVLFAIVYATASMRIRH